MTSQSWETRRPSNSSSTIFCCQLDRKAPAILWLVLLIQGPQLQSSLAGVEGHHSSHLHNRACHSELHQHSNTAVCGNLTVAIASQFIVVSLPEWKLNLIFSQKIVTGLAVAYLTVLCMKINFYNCFIMSYSTELTDIKIGVSRKHFYSLN